MAVIQAAIAHTIISRGRVILSATVILSITAAVIVGKDVISVGIPSGFSVEHSARAFLATYFWICLFGTLTPCVVLLALRRRAPPSPDQAASPPFISIVIPAYNEQEKIAQAIDAAQNQNYPSFEVIVIDDGSRDFTRFIAESYDIRLIRQPKNGGKFQALNAGVAAARADIIVTSDSDSMLHRDTLKFLAPHFDNPDVGAVAGAIRPSSSQGLVRKFQAIEYIWGQEVLKLGQTGSGASVTVCPGPVTAFRRGALEAIGGFKGRTITEDFDATLDTIAAGWRVEFDPRAIALTDAPRTFKALAHQRLRWSRGTLQTFRVHRGMFCNPAAGLAGLVWLPWFFLTGYGLLAFDLAVLVLCVPLVLLGSSAELLVAGLIYILIIEATVVFQYMLGLFLAGERRGSLYLAAILMKILNLLLAWTRIESVYFEWRGKSASW